MFRKRTIWLSAFAALVLALAVAPAAGAKPVPGPGGPATRPLEIPYLSHGQGVDKSLFRGEVQRHEGVLAGYGEQPAAQDPIEIPYLSQGIGVDKSLFKDRATARKAGETSGGYYDPAGSSWKTTEPPVSKAPLAGHYDPASSSWKTAEPSAPASPVVVTPASGGFDWTDAGFGLAGVAAAAALVGAAIFAMTRSRRSPLATQ
jgi:hypothetical protein